MPAFRYQALDVNGRTTTGVVDAQTTRLARTQLRQQGLFPERLEAVDAVFAKRGGIGAGQLMLATQQWAALLAAGLTVEQSLTALIEQVEASRVRELLAALRADVRAGHSLASAMGRQPQVFSDIYRSLVAAGEKSGRLPQVLERLAAYLEGRQAAARRLLEIIAYPLVLVTAAGLIVTGMMTYVVPQIAAVFAHSKQSLPFLTHFLIELAGLIRAWGLLALGGVTAIAYALARLLRQKRYLRLAQLQLLRLPLLGKLLRLGDAARLTATLAILVDAGVPLLAALEAGRDVLWLQPMREAVDGAVAEVREGGLLSRALGRTGMLPPIVIYLTASAEKSGALAEMLDRASRQVQADLRHRLGVVSALFEPLLVLLMGAMVLVVVLAMLAPILDINLTLR